MFEGIKKKIEKVTVIGLGSLGGYFTNNLVTKAKWLKKINLVDFDVVEEKNVTNSIYNSCHVDKRKVDVLTDMIKTVRPDIHVFDWAVKYDKTLLTKDPDNLIIDCRDTTSRDKNIDVKLQILSDNLIIDCKKDTDVGIPGDYFHSIDSLDLINAAETAATIVASGNIFNFIKGNTAHLFELNEIETKVKEFCEFSEIKTDEMRYEYMCEKRIKNISQWIPRIIKVNKSEKLVANLTDSSFIKHLISTEKNNVKDEIDVYKFFNIVVEGLDILYKTREPKNYERQLFYIEDVTKEGTIHLMRATGGG